MISLDHDRSLSRVALDRFDDIGGIGTVSHQVAEERVTGRSDGTGVTQASVERLAVGMDVGEEREKQSAPDALVAFAPVQDTT